MVAKTYESNRHNDPTHNTSSVVVLPSAHSSQPLSPSNSSSTLPLSSHNLVDKARSMTFVYRKASLAWHNSAVFSLESKYQHVLAPPSTIKRRKLSLNSFSNQTLIDLTSGTEHSGFCKMKSKSTDALMIVDLTESDCLSISDSTDTDYDAKSAISNDPESEIAIDSTDFFNRKSITDPYDFNTDFEPHRLFESPLLNCSPSLIDSNLFLTDDNHIPGFYTSNSTRGQFDPISQAFQNTSLKNSHFDRLLTYIPSDALGVVFSFFSLTNLALVMGVSKYIKNAATDTITCCVHTFDSRQYEDGVVCDALRLLFKYNARNLKKFTFLSPFAFRTDVIYDIFARNRHSIRFLEIDSIHLTNEVASALNPMAFSFAELNAKKCYSQLKTTCAISLEVLVLSGLSFPRIPLERFCNMQNLKAIFIIANRNLGCEEDDLARSTRHILRSNSIKVLGTSIPLFGQSLLDSKMIFPKLTHLLIYDLEPDLPNALPNITELCTWFPSYTFYGNIFLPILLRLLNLKFLHLCFRSIIGYDELSSFLYELNLPRLEIVFLHFGTQNEVRIAKYFVGRMNQNQIKMEVLVAKQSGMIIPLCEAAGIDIFTASTISDTKYDKFNFGFPRMVF